MYPEKLEEMCLEDQMMWYSFRSFSPSIGKFPHCIFYSREEILSSILNMLNKKGGIWGKACFSWNVDDTLYSANDYSYYTTDFKLWELPKNQDYLLMMGWRPANDGFVMVIDAETPVEILEDMYFSHQELKYDFNYYQYLEYCCNWINKLEWAYIPLDNECGHAIFVTRDKYDLLIQKIVAKLVSNNETIIQLKPDNNRYYWKTLT